MWSEILLSVLVSTAASGGILWKVLDFAFARKLAFMQAEHEAALKASQTEHEAALRGIQAEREAILSAATHAQNTRFSRIDQQRADAILKLDAAIRRYMWLQYTFLPREISNVLPWTQAMQRVFELQSQASDVLKIHMEFGLFFTENFSIKLTFAWHQKAWNIPFELGKAITTQCESEEFRAMGHYEQLEFMRSLADKNSPADREAFATVSRELRNELATMFHGVEFGKVAVL